MISFKKALFFGAVFFVTALNLTQPIFAQEKQEEKSDSATSKAIDALYITPLVNSNGAIQNDINETKDRIQKMTDPGLQANEITNLLLRVVGRMSSYTVLDYNIDNALFAFDINNIPFILMGKSRPPGNTDVPWFELMKDSKNIPEIKDPLTLIETIQKNFDAVARISVQAVEEAKAVILEKPSSRTPNKIPPIQGSAEIKENVIKYRSRLGLPLGLAL